MTGRGGEDEDGPAELRLASARLRVSAPAITIAAPKGIASRFRIAAHPSTSQASAERVGDPNAKNPIARHATR